MDSSIKLFSKKWFENYWFYYKHHTWAGIFVLFLLVYTLVECMNAVAIDSTVTYMGGTFFDQEITAEFEEAMSEVIDDTDGDGVKKVMFSSLLLTNELKSEQDMAMQQKAQIEVAAGETYLYIMDEEIFNQYCEQELFEDLAEYIDVSEGTFGVSVDELPELKSLGFSDNTKAYVGIRVMMRGDEGKAKKIIMRDNAIKILKNLHKKG